MSTLNRGRPTKRRRHHHHHHGFAASASSSTITSNEERLLLQAIQSSKLPTSARNGKIEVPWGPTFYPTREEMEGSPLDYIDKIRPVAQRYGICKIVPPMGWSTDFFGEFRVDLSPERKTMMIAWQENYTAPFPFIPGTPQRWQIASD